MLEVRGQGCGQKIRQISNAFFARKYKLTPSINVFLENRFIFVSDPQK